MESKADSKQQMSLAELERVLSELHAKARDNMDVLPVEEKKKLLELFGTVVERVGAIQKDLKQSVDTTDHEGMVLKMCGQFPRDSHGTIRVPTKENLTSALNSIVSNPRLPLFSVQFINKEENFNFLFAGPTSPNYLFRDSEVYIGLESVEQARHLSRLSSEGRSITVIFGSSCEQRGSFQFSTPTLNTRTREDLREIGTLLTRLKKVDDALKALGAVPGRGGVPELSDMLIQDEDFDTAVQRFKENPESKVLLHSFLCTRTRVNKRKRQESLDPLVDERIEILLKLSQFSPDEYPVRVEREFK